MSKASERAMVRWRFLLALTSIALLSGCGSLSALDYQPLTTPAQWCAQRPCVDVGDVTLAEPTSSVLVFLLALVWIIVGVYFVATRLGQRCRAWLGASLIFGGIAAGSAGISYQAFSYALKCAGRQYCQLTNGYEVTYSVLQAASVSAMVVAVAYACGSSRVQRGVLIYAVFNVLVYLVVTAWGVLAPSALALSFEVLMVFAVPAIVITAALAWSHVRVHHDETSRRILWAVALLVLVQVAYFAYYAIGVAAALWAGGSGVYFSANDVLHVGMLGWLAYVFFALRSCLRDSADGTVPSGE